MANHERGVYEPLSDDIQVFDGAEDDVDEEGSRLPLLIVIALLVLAAFGGVVWLAYTQGVQRGRSDAPRIIAAAPGPVKTAPGNPGGEPTQYKGLKIYEQPAPADDAASEETETPPPPTAIGPNTKSETLPDGAMPVQPAPQTAQAPKAETPKAETPKAETPKVAAATQTTKPKPVVQAETAKPKPVAAPTIATAPPKSLAAVPPAETKAPATGGAYVLQIGAYKSEADANAAWHAYQAKHPIAGGYGSDVKQVDLGDKGVWYRLRIGSFADKDAANALCDKLKADGAICFPTKP